MDNPLQKLGMILRFVEQLPHTWTGYSFPFNTNGIGLIFQHSTHWPIFKIGQINKSHFSFHKKTDLIFYVLQKLILLCKHTFSSNPVKSIISKRFINFEKIQLLLIFSNPNIDNVSVTVALNGRAYEHCYRYNSNKIFIYYF